MPKTKSFISKRQSLKNIKFLILQSLLISAMFLSCTSETHLLVKEDNNGINILFNNVERLTGFKSTISEDISTINVSVEDNFVVVNLEPNGNLPADPKEMIGTFFERIPEFKHGVTLWRYKPWNSWSKPILINSPSEMEDWDVQFFYWEYNDGMFGACMPLCGEGYRTTLGQFQGKFGAKSASYGPGADKNGIPQMAIGFGKDPFLLFRDLYRTGLAAMGKSENRIDNKVFPDRLDYIGWCTWNASENGKKLNEEHVVEGVKSFTDNNFPLGWVIIDDGWFNHSGQKLNSILPDKEKFPDGFKNMNRRLKEECGLKEIGIWHAFNGYWNGINPDSELGEKYKNELFSWKQKPSPLSPDSVNLVTYSFIKPESDSLLAFYRNLHKMLSEQGFTFLKVDNQLVVERMAVENYPIFTLSEKMHEALYKSADEYFEGVIINCMDMTADAYFNFGNSSVARAVEDYFPAEHGGVGYEMYQGNAAVHLVMAFYNSIYFQQMVYPDFDMFESSNPHAQFHAVARAINNGPVYVTDKPGKQNFELLKRLCYSDGKLIRASKALTPTFDCLFQVQQAKPFKAFSMSGVNGLLGVWNLADAENVSGTLSPSDVYGIKGDDFIVYEYFSGDYWEISKNEKIDINLKKMGCQLYYVIPHENEVAAVGLVDKYNAPGTILSQKTDKGLLEVTVADYGKFLAVIPEKPKEVLLDGEKVEFDFNDNKLVVEIQSTMNRKERHLIINW